MTLLGDLSDLFDEVFGTRTPGKPEPVSESKSESTPEEWWVAYNVIEVVTGGKRKGRPIAIAATRIELYEKTKDAKREIVLDLVTELTEELKLLRGK